MKGPVFMYYRLTNFYQNHRQYIKNFDFDQFLGDRVGSATLRTNCDPLAYSSDGKVIYPCGLIANSMFNDTASNLTSVDATGTYEMTTKGIAWPTDKQKYGPTKYQISEIVPPPNWALRYPNGQYTEEFPPPDLSTQDRFMVWMHVAALPDFRKIWARNDDQDLPAGRWRVSIDMNFDTLQYGGTKWLVLSTTTALGGRNPYLGIAFMSIGALCIVLGILFTLRHLIKPRKLGDESYLSWNQPGGGLPSNSRALALQSYCQAGYKPIENKDLQLDLTPLNREFVVYQNESTPPTTLSIVTQLNLCEALPIPDEKDNTDICTKGALICRKTVYAKKLKDDKETEFVAIVQNIAVDVEETNIMYSKLKPEFKPIDAEADATKRTFNKHDQSASITLECDESQSRSDSIKAGEKVPDHKDDKNGDDKKKEEESKGMSGMGIFFTIVLVLAAVYFIGGAFYNFKVYNARGRDLIPHLGKFYFF
ncbi:ligand-effect modulator 3 family [Mucor mucedo]|uniref:ligand-effect modulator 3 family n=1 Tax=Mucor mucedo TaxID=29922 RepID=UPI00221EAB32|nr:ligand-effect modulator 3 family [Mucor mucedo]KAI7897015.1 ligand-effect modulator 3 family [Mucor mucedo]